MIQTLYIRFQGRIKNPVRHLRGCFVEIINGIEPLTILIKHFILNIWQGSKYASDFKIHTLTFNFFKTTTIEIARVSKTC